MAFRPRIRLRWYALGILTGLSAAFATYWWFDGPRWRNVSPGSGHTPHFSRDGQTLTTFHGLQAKSGEPFQPRIVKWDTASGRKLSDVPLIWEDPPPTGSWPLIVTPLPDDTHFIVGKMLESSSEVIYRSYIHDAKDGHKVVGPIDADHWIRRHSLDSRWCAAMQDSGRVIAIISTDTGLTCQRLPLGQGDLSFAVSFSPDGNRVAVHWRPDVKDGRHVVKIYELPSGRELHRLELPDRPWQNVYSWESDNRLYAEVNEPDPASPAYHFRRSFSFSMADSDFGAERPEPLRVGHRADAGTQIFWENGDGWVAHLTSLDLDDRPMLQRSFGWIDRHFRTSLAKSWESGLRIEMFDAGTGALRAVLPRVGRLWRTFSNDGRWIASAGEAVEVWSVPPPRQSLWATCAGLAALGIVLTVGQRRSRPTHD